MVLKNRKIPFLFGVLLILIGGFYWQLTRLGYAVPLPYVWEVLCLINCQNDAENISHVILPGNQLLNYNKPIAQILGTENIDKNKSSILVEKSKYRLTLYYNKQPIKSYPVVFGSDPVNDKFKEGDQRTPEGKFQVKDLYPHIGWSKFLWLDYPTKNSWKKHLKAKFDGKINWNNSIGGEIGIHGTPNDGLIEKRKNWTLGCISLKNRDVDELYTVVQKGTEVEIVR